MKSGLIEFIEFCEKKKIDKEGYYTYFNIHVATGYNHEAIWYREPYYSSTISLDDEDLEYLYNKYILQYKEAVIERDEENIARKEKEIKELEEQLNRLKNEQ